MIKKQIISGEASAYKRGVVLGLTMAEILLILMFCLLFLGLIAFKEFREVNSGQDSNFDNQMVNLNERLIQIQEKEQQLIERESQVDNMEKLASELSTSKQQNEDQIKLIEEKDKAIAQNQNEIKNLNTEIVELQEQVEIVDEIFENDQSTPIDEDWQKLIERDELIKILKEKHNLTPKEIQSVLDELKSFMEMQVDKNLADKSLSELIELAKNKWPPFIDLSEAKGYSFKIGKATLNPKFESDLKGKIGDQLLELANKYNADYIEVIGHTDEQPVVTTTTNLDGSLIHVMNGEIPVNSLSPGDNAGLGIARAVSVAKVLSELEKLSHLTIIPLSGGQLILPGDKISSGEPGDVKERRRIEIRVRRTSQDYQFE